MLFELARELGYSVLPLSGSPVQEFSSAPPPQSPAPDEHRPALDGTFAGLIQSYRQYEKSPYRQLKHKVRLNYDFTLNRIDREIGSERLAEWDARRIQYLYDEKWAAGGKISMGHSMIGKLRLLTSFGSVVLNDDACTRLSTILGNMRFPNSRGREEILSVEQARAIRATAHNHFNWGSIALAQAFQIAFPKLRQADIIGDWVPISEPGTSEIVNGNEKWVRGLRWSDIDENMVMRRVFTSGRRNQKELEPNLKNRGGVIEEINRVPLEKRAGPMIICEFNRLPWTAYEFRRKWRMVADKAGIPKSVQFSDSVRALSGKDEESELGADTAL